MRHTNGTKTSTMSWGGLFITFLSLCLCTLLPYRIAMAMPLEARDPSHTAADPRSDFDTSPLGVNALSHAPRSSFTTQGSQNPRGAELAGWLQEHMAKGTPLDALAALRKKLGTHVEAWRHPQDGTLRMIKADALQRSLPNFAPGKSQARETARAFLNANKAVLRLQSPDRELVWQRSEQDALGYRHIRFNQTFGGLSIWPKTDLIVHLNTAGDVYMMNGVYIPTPETVQTVPTLSADDALAFAQGAVPWGANSTSSAPELIIYTPSASAPSLAWRIEIVTSLTAHWMVVIDAHNGDTLTAFNQVMTENRLGSGIDLFGQTQAINIWEENGLFFLVDTSKAMFDPTSNPPDPSTTRGAIIIQDARNQPATNRPEALPDLFQITSSSSTSGWLADGVSALYGFSETYDYFLERHNRDSLNGQGGQILATVRLGQNYRNAAFISALQMMIFGDALPFAGALDVVGHELTHGVVNNSANLVYQDQSGALNEAFADIFGTMVEARTNGQVDWELGNQLGTVLRNMKDPSSIEVCCGRQYPSKMSELLTVDDPDPQLGEVVRDDNGGVHINSSIINHAFYQLAEGLNGAIGLRDAEQIFYRALTTQLVRSSEFLDARLACIQSAEELFGADSVQVMKTGEAFDVVEIFDGAPTPEPMPSPGVDGPDSTIFARRAETMSGSIASFLARRETAFADPPDGRLINPFAILPRRPTVTGDGQLVFYVDTLNDLCAIPTDASALESCLGRQGTIHSVSLSPSGELAAVVLLDALGNPDNRILLLDLVNLTSEELPLLAPTQDGIPIGTVLFADVIDFTSDDQFMLYDALNAVTLSDGTQLELWSLFAIDLVNRTTLTIITPIPGVNVGNPAVGQTSDILITFERFDIATGLSEVFASNLNSGETALVGQVEGVLAYPGYNGDDRSIVYTVPNPSVRTGASLVEQPLAEDRITPVGAPQDWLAEGAFGVIYRRAPAAALTLDR